MKSNRQTQVFVVTRFVIAKVYCIARAPYQTIGPPTTIKMEPSPGQQSSLVNLSIFLFSCLQFFITSSRASPSACYYATNGTVYESPDYVVPCGNGSATVSSPQSCCDLSANNKCLSAGLCYDPNVLDGSYYTSPCTDPTYGASECPQYCSE